MNDKRFFAIGDIHGCIVTLRELLFEKLKIEPDDNVFLVGDLIDRGPDNKAVLDLLMALIEQGYHIYPVRGNHEEMLLDYIYHNDNSWLYNGADSTLKSFGVRKAKDIDEKYILFLKGLPYFRVTDKFIITHAGLNCHIDNPFDDTFSMVWTRDNHIDLKKTGGKRVISGHTPNTIQTIRDSLSKNKIQIDGGCVYYRRFPDAGYLCAVSLDTLDLYVCRNIDIIK